MDWRRSCSIGTMQIGRPSEVQRTIPVAWYFAPPGAKTFYGVNAFVSGLEDRDTPALPPLLGQQPPYASPYSTGQNVWGYLGQCKVGTDEQYADGLSAADLAAPPAPIPACCAAPKIGQTWFLRHNLTPKNVVVPGLVVGSNWNNIGDAIDAGVLSDTPGTAPEGPNFTFSGFTAGIPPRAYAQYLSPPLPAQTIPSQVWRFAVGQTITDSSAQKIKWSWTLSIIDGATGLQKSEIETAQVIGGQPVTSLGNHGVEVIRLVADAIIAFGDFLCLEVGWLFQVFPPGVHSYDQTILDSGSLPTPSTGANAGNPLSLLQWPPGGGDVDMPIVGTIVPFAGISIPFGYLVCDGSVQLAVNFPALFAAIGTTWGVGGPGTFLLPDLRDRTVIGKSPGGLGPTRPTARAVGDVAGEETHMLSTPELANHVHTVTDPGHQHDIPADTSALDIGGNVSVIGSTQPAVTTIANGTAAAITGVSVDAAGGGLAHNNMQPFAVVTWLIKW